MWLSIMGNSALFIDVVKKGDIAAKVAADMSTAVFAMYQHFPMAGFLVLVTTLIIAIFFITSADSATFVMAMFTSGGELNPSAGLKITWGLIEGAVAIALMVAGGLMLVMFAMCVSLVKAFQKEV